MRSSVCLARLSLFFRSLWIPTPAWRADVLSRFIKPELRRLEALNDPDDAAGKVEELNDLFRRYALAA